MNSILRKNFAITFGLLTLVFGIISQTILPFFYPQLFVDGVFYPLKDPHTYIKLATAHADQVRTLGWVVFDWTPDAQFPAGVLAGLFAISGIYSPLWQVMINVIFVGATAYVFEKIFSEFKIPKRAAFIILLTLMFTPSSITWTTQVMKDVYIVFGIICLFYSFILIRNETYVKSFIWFSIGAWMMFFVKSFYSEIFLMCYGASLSLSFIFKKNRSFKFILLSLFMMMTFAYQFTHANKHYASIPNKNEVINVKIAGSNDTQEVEFLYDQQFAALDLIFERLSYRNFIFYKRFPHGNENSINRKLNSTMSAILYLPEALKISFLEPLPWRYKDDVSLIKRILFILLQIEMIFLYITMLLIYLGRNSFSFDEKSLFLSWMIIATSFLIIYAYASPNLGAINRYRFPFLMTIKCLGGVAGWRLYESGYFLNFWDKFKDKASLKNT